MSRVRVHNFTISLDGFATGEGQSLETPFGHAGQRLHNWMFATRFARREVFGELVDKLAKGGTNVEEEVSKVAAIMVYVGIIVFCLSAIQTNESMPAPRSHVHVTQMGPLTVFFPRHSPKPIDVRLNVNATNGANDDD